jgi:hypothetical protein
MLPLMDECSLYYCRRFALAFKCFAFVEPTVFFEN